MTTGKNAMLGIGNKSRTSGSAAVRIPIHQPMARPSAVPGINAIRKEVISRPRVVPAWSHNSPPTARPMNVLTIFDGGGKKAARKKPAWTKNSQAATATRDVASGMVNSREKSRRVREGITLLHSEHLRYFYGPHRFERLERFEQLEPAPFTGASVYSWLIAVSTSSRRQAQISNDIFVYEFQPRISILRGRGSSTEYSALIRPGLAVSNTTLSDI